MPGLRRRPRSNSAAGDELANSRVPLRRRRAPLARQSAASARLHRRTGDGSGPHESPKELAMQRRVLSVARRRGHSANQWRHPLTRVPPGAMTTGGGSAAARSEPNPTERNPAGRNPVRQNAAGVAAPMVRRLAGSPSALCAPTRSTAGPAAPVPALLKARTVRRVRRAGLAPPRRRVSSAATGAQGGAQQPKRKLGRRVDPHQSPDRARARRGRRRHEERSIGWRFRRTR